MRSDIFEVAVAGDGISGCQKTSVYIYRTQILCPVACTVTLLILCPVVYGCVRLVISNGYGQCTVVYSRVRKKNHKLPDNRTPLYEV